MKEKKKIAPGFEISVFKSFTKEGISPDLIYEPILIPLIRLFREGNPPGILYPIIIKKNKAYYYFGTMCVTKYKKIIFFPGLRTPIVIDEVKKISGTLEHVTTDENYSKTHIKFKDRTKKFSNLHIIKINSYYYWFTIAINSLENLDQNNQGEITVSVPNKDSKRRKNEILKAYKKSEAYFLDLSGISYSDKNFLNFDFYFTDKKKNDFSDINLFSTIAKPVK